MLSRKPAPRKTIRRAGRDWIQAKLRPARRPPGPALFVKDPANPSCTNDYIVFTINTPGGATHFNIIAFNNLYVNTANNGLCAGTRPSILFAYNASTAGVTGEVGLNGSPVISLDGTLIAFVENVAGGGVTNRGYFHVLK